MNWPERVKTQPHDDRDNCFQHFDSKGPCGMTVNNDIGDDSATKHSDSHTLHPSGHVPADAGSNVWRSTVLSRRCDDVFVPKQRTHACLWGRSLPWPVIQLVSDNRAEQFHTAYPDTFRS